MGIKFMVDRGAAVHSQFDSLAVCRSEEVNPNGRSYWSFLHRSGRRPPGWRFGDRRLRLLVCSMVTRFSTGSGDSTISAAGISARELNHYQGPVLSLLLPALRDEGGMRGRHPASLSLWSSPSTGAEIGFFLIAVSPSPPQAGRGTGWPASASP